MSETTYIDSKKGMNIQRHDNSRFRSVLSQNTKQPKKLYIFSQFLLIVKTTLGDRSLSNSTGKTLKHNLSTILESASASVNPPYIKTSVRRYAYRLGLFGIGKLW